MIDKTNGIPSSSGGVIVFTKTGLIHYADRRYSGNFNEKVSESGRPEKDKIKVTTDIKFHIN
jgi:hypothetical protein